MESVRVHSTHRTPPRAAADTHLLPRSSLWRRVPRYSAMQRRKVGACPDTTVPS